LSSEKIQLTCAMINFTKYISGLPGFAESLCQIDELSDDGILEHREAGRADAWKIDF
jgi:hypothetical protein